MAKASYPVSSTRAFGIFLEKAFLQSGAALIDMVKPAPGATTFTTASNPVANTRVRTYIMNSGSAQTLTVPSGLTNVNIGEEIVVVSKGAGVVTIAAGDGATIDKLAPTFKSNGANSVIRILKTAANAYTVSGDLAAS